MSSDQSSLPVADPADGPSASRCSLAAKQENEVNDQDDDNRQLKHKSSSLVELIHHGAIEICCGSKFFLHQPAVVRYADLRGGQAIDPRPVKIAEKLNGVICPLRQFFYIQPDGIEVLGLPRQPPAGEERVSMVERLVNIRKDAGQMFVVMPEVQQLTIGILEELPDRDGALG